MHSYLEKGVKDFWKQLKLSNISPGEDEDQLSQAQDITECCAVDELAQLLSK